MKPSRRVAVATLLVVLVGLILFSESAHRAVLRGLHEAEQIAAVQPVIAMVLIVTFSALAAMLAFVPSRSSSSSTGW